MSSVTRTPLEPRRKDGKIYSHARKIWLVETPEEKVRQEYLCTLVNEYGYQVEQIAEELIVTGRGSGNARADFVIWRTTTDREANKLPLVVVECKADNVTIDQKTYEQGAHYAQYVRAPFFVTHNNRETKFWKVDLERLAPNFAEIENIPHADASDKQIDELVKKLKVFKEDEFADLLHKCHNVIRNRDHLDPAAAFDEIAKILFVKVWVEREMKKKRQRQNLFTVEFLESQLGDNPLNSLFNETKQHYATDKIFKEDERINLKPNTGSEIVKLLERYNLSDTSEDVKGIAFERFLGRTFRGEIGQFFTPRSIVEFMIRIVAPAEGDVICDPASGSGGFLIRFFEIVREQVLADIDRRYNAYREEMESRADLSLEERAKLLRAEFEKLQKEIDQTRKTARLWTLANRCIYGTDANERMARTSKMNMIMHGDGHGGVHHHNGFLNVNGIFEQRFDIVLTNPPFGSNVEESDKVLEAQARVSDEVYERYLKDYGEAYREAQERVSAAFDNKQSIAELFTLPKRAQSKVKTEILFIERCLALLKPGGRLGIVLPEGVFNNPSCSMYVSFAKTARLFARW
jgi:type I restriction enzyme M protein